LGPEKTFGDVMRTVEQAQKLIQTVHARTHADLYRRFDADLQPVERHIPDCVRSWDEIV
jgi:hypothetical protein